MKNSGFLKTTTLMLGLVITIASCTKDNDPSVNPNPGVPGDDKVLGQIYDYGSPVSPMKGELVDMRVMLASFTNVGEVVNDATSYVMFLGKEVNLTFIVDGDDMIPSGGYVFNAGNDPQSFTITAGTATIVETGESGTQFDYSVTGGEVSVNYNGTGYSFYFDLLLENGDYLRGSAEGTMRYQDVHQ